MARLSDLGLDISPLEDPLSYPGRSAATSSLLVGDHLLAVAETPRRRLDHQQVQVDGPTPGLGAGVSVMALDQVLGQLEVAPLGDRTAVMAFGSNACPGQMRTKLLRAEVSSVLPMIRATVEGWRPAVAAHVSRPGYLPITPVPDGDAVKVAVVLVFCDRAQLAAIDRSEGNYRRVRASTAARTGSGTDVSDCHLYRAAHGALAATEGRPLAWSGEWDAISTVMDLLPATGDRPFRSPTDFVTRCRADEALRARVRDQLAAAGHVTAVDR